MCSNTKTIIIGGGPAGLFTAYLLLKSGRKNVHIYERSDKLGGDWSANLPYQTHSTMVLFRYGTNIKIFTDIYNELNNTQLSQDEWLDSISLKTKYSIMEELLPNIDILDVLKILSWRIRSSNIYEKSVKQMIEESNISVKGIRFLKILCNLGVDGISNTSAGTILSLIYDQIGIRKLLYQSGTALHLKVPKEELWEMMKDIILKLGGIIYLNTDVTIQKGTKASLVIRDNFGRKIDNIVLNRDDKVVVATGEDNLINPKKYLMEEWAQINIPNFPPIGKVITQQILFEDSLDRNIFDKYDVLSGVDTEWNIVISLDHSQSQMPKYKKDSLLVCTLIGIDIKSSKLNKKAKECNEEELRGEIIRQIKSIPSLSKYCLPKVIKIYGNIKPIVWAHTGLIPNERIKLKDHENIHWASFLRNKKPGISNLATAADAAISVTKEITGREIISLEWDIPIWLEYLLVLLFIIIILVNWQYLLNIINKIINWFNDRLSKI
jgi:hypothetical protein